MPERRVFDLEGRARIATLIWLNQHQDEPEHKTTSGVRLGVDTHSTGIKQVREALEDLKLIETTGKPQSGHGSSVSLHLTKAGVKAGEMLLDIDAELRKATGSPAAPDLRNVLAVNYPVVRFEEYGSIRIPLRILEVDEDPEQCFRRALERDVGCMGHAFNNARDELFKLGILQEQGISKGGRGARLTYSLTPFGRLIMTKWRAIDEKVVPKGAVKKRRVAA